MLDQFCCTVVKRGNLLLLDEARLRGVKRCIMIGMMCWVRLVDKVQTDFLRDRVVVVVKIKVVILQNRLQ